MNICVTTKEESGEDEQKSMSTKWKQSFKKDGDIARAVGAGELLVAAVASGVGVVVTQGITLG